jgi:hypothetical protein
MFKYLPVIAVITIVINIVLIIYRINHWAIDSTYSIIAWILLGILEIIMIYYTWQPFNNISSSSKILWTVGILFVPVLIIPWWFMRVYPNLKHKIS